ncbi:MAG: beta-N-acetylhexosaminidase [Clostridia bacterium]|nr:beta-N-acetylhexosaminidase [Clostridia bacterium]
MQYKTMGVMLDMSRNAVMKVSQLKKYVDYLAAMGFNAVELYTEDTFKIEDEPYFGYLRGGYTAAEIKEVDAYAASKGIELIPCIQTLAHFTNTKKLPYYWDLFDCDDILCIGEPKVYEFLDKIFKTLSENFTSRKVNIGMDEAHNVGLGKYLEKNGYRDRSEILVEHLNKVVEIAEKYGFKCHMWSDMFFRLISGGAYDPELLKNVHVSPEVAAKVPESVALTYWDYYSTEKKKYDLMFEKHLEFGRDVWFAGGAWAWQGFSPLGEFSIRSMRPAMESVREKGIENVIFTVWGDNGKDCSYFALLPTLYVIRQFADGNFDMEKIKADMKEKFGWDYDEWLDLDLPNDLRVNGVKDDKWNCVCKTMAFTDPFLGMRDVDYANIDRIPYGEYGKKIASHAQNAGEFSYIFDTLAKLCAYMEYKADLGIRTRKAYQEKNTDELKRLVEDYASAVACLDVFAEAQKKLWMRENKAFGWEVQEIRLGGVRARLLTCGERLQAYLNGDLDCIEELEEKVLPNLDRNGFMYHLYRETVAPSDI